MAHDPAHDSSHSSGEHAAENLEHPGEEHAESHGKGHKHKGDGHGDHAGGHGGAWLITYCDMITLLIACFICIITFSNKEPEKLSQRKDSILNGTGGDGFAGDRSASIDQDSILWRTTPVIGRTGKRGSEIAPSYSDPVLEAKQVLRQLDGPTIGNLGDRYTLRFSLAALFESEKKLSSTGHLILQAIGRNFSKLPYEIIFQVNAPDHMSKAILMSQYLMGYAAIHPSRLAVGVGETGDSWQPSVSLIFSRRS